MALKKNPSFYTTTDPQSYKTPPTSNDLLVELRRQSYLLLCLCGLLGTRTTTTEIEEGLKEIN